MFILEEISSIISVFLLNLFKGISIIATFFGSAAMSGSFVKL